MVFADFDSVNTHIVAHFKLPTRRRWTQDWEEVT